MASLALFSRTSLLLARAGAAKFCMPKTIMIPAQRALTRPPFIQKMYDKLDEIESSIDEEAKIGANLPFSIANPRRLALKMIIFIGIAFNLPFVIVYYQLKAARAG